MLAMSLYVSHVVVSASVVYRADKETNYLFCNGGSQLLTTEEMEEKVKQDKALVKKEGLEGEFDEFLEVKCGNMSMRIDEHGEIDIKVA